MFATLAEVAGSGVVVRLVGIWGACGPFDNVAAADASAERHRKHRATAAFLALLRADLGVDRFES
jgi:hypothetical protein